VLLSVLLVLLSVLLVLLRRRRCGSAKVLARFCSHLQ
jgi:hypothetical protein